MHGAQILQVRGNFDAALVIVRELPPRAPVVAVNSFNPMRIEGQKTPGFEIVDILGDAPDVHCSAVGKPGRSRLRRDYREYRAAGRSTRLPRMLGFQAAGAAPIVEGHRIDRPETVATAIRIGNPASRAGATGAACESADAISAVADDQIPDGFHFLAEKESVFCEPAAAASAADLSKTEVPPGSRVVCVRTGNGLKDPDVAIRGARIPDVVNATLGPVLTTLTF